MTENPILRPGDFFSTNFPEAELGTIINGVQKFHSIDNQSECSHSGIIVNSDGLTFEALKQYKHQMLWPAYGDPGVKLIIGRHRKMTTEAFEKAHIIIKEKYRAKVFGRFLKADITGYTGKTYPVLRLPLFLAPSLAKISPFGFGVCSETTVRHLYLCGFVNSWRRWNPDNVTDYIVRDRMVDIVYHKNIESYDQAYLDAGGEQ